METKCSRQTISTALPQLKFKEERKEKLTVLLLGALSRIAVDESGGSGGNNN